MTNGWQHIDQMQTQEVRVPEPAPEHRKGNGFLLFGLVMGRVFGLIHAWLINPVIYSHGTPAGLQEVDKAPYRSLIAQVHAVTGDLERAQLRLTVLEDEDPYLALGAQAQRCMADGNPSEARALALLTSALGQTLPTTTASPIPTQTLDFSTSTP